MDGQTDVIFRPRLPSVTAQQLGGAGLPLYYVVYMPMVFDKCGESPVWVVPLLAGIPLLLGFCTMGVCIVGMRKYRASKRQKTPTYGPIGTVEM